MIDGENLQVVQRLLEEQNDALLSELCRRLQERTGTRNLVFVDESGVNLGIARLWARAMRGERAVGHQRREHRRECVAVGRFES